MGLGHGLVREGKYVTRSGEVVEIVLVGAKWARDGIGRMWTAEGGNGLSFDLRTWERERDLMREVENGIE